MESQTEYRNRLYKHIASYCYIKCRQREIRNRQETADNIVFTIVFVLFVVCISSLDGILDVVFKAL